jgi:transcriptional regulator with XRE-family HTH domain
LDVSLLIRQRLKELGLEQKDLAAAAQVTESYISQLLARKKTPPAPARTDIYEKIGRILKLPSGELSHLADLQRKEALRKKVAEPSRPLFKECRGLILRKCDPTQEKELRRIFEKEPFGELERLVTQKLLDVAQEVAKDELESGEWPELPAQIGNRSYENCVSFLDTVIESWDIDLKTFGMEVVLKGSLKRFEFAERETQQPFAIQPGLEQFLQDRSLSGDATGEEVEFLKALKFRGKQPSPIYYYRELQNLRDPLHFLPAPTP